MQPAECPAHAKPILLCLSHLRWGFVTQRPQHLMARAAQSYRVIFWEEPHYGGPDTAPRMMRESGPDGMEVLAPILPWSGDDRIQDDLQRGLLDAELRRLGGAVAVAWFYTPMALAFAGDVPADLTVYDCMDELAAFDGAPARLAGLERRLMRQAGLVFTGGHSLHRARQGLHRAAHCFPSAVDRGHYAQARLGRLPDPADQAGIPHPRIGFFGVLDERLDAGLVEAVADLRPDWHIVLVGPVAKIDVSQLPSRPNIHWLGPKAYGELPAYLAHWDAGLMPFALNAATRFISPTKTPEFLAAGVPLVSTRVADVVAAWSGVVAIADDAAGAVLALAQAMARPRAPWLAQVDAALAGLSWDATWSGMATLIDQAAPLAGEAA